MPSRTNNEYYYKDGVYLSLKEDILYFYADSFQCFDESIIDYINSLSNQVNIVVFRGKAEQNETASFNMFCDLLTRYSCNKRIVVDVGENALTFGQGADLYFEDLPEYVKLSNVYDFIGSNIYIGKNSFDWWCLNLSEERFNKLLTKVTPLTRDRMLKLDYLAKEAKRLFYSQTLHLDSKDKMDYVFAWFRKNIGLDKKAIKPGGGIKSGHSYSQDQYQTYKRKLGVCAGRARLLKTMLNNRYMKVPCFVVSGYGLGDMHEWNALLVGDEVLYYDLSARDVVGVPFSKIEDKYKIWNNCDIDSSRYYIATELASNIHEQEIKLPPPLPRTSRSKKQVKTPPPLPSKDRPKQYVKTPPPLPRRDG